MQAECIVRDRRVIERLKARAEGIAPVVGSQRMKPRSSADISGTITQPSFNSSLQLEGKQT